MRLSERKLRILSSIIEGYIKTGEPIGSKTLQHLLNESFSSATLRNEMAELMKLGFLEQVHTSSGRVPSYTGYRLYVDKLMRKKSLSEDKKRRIDEHFKHRANTIDDFLDQAAGVLANVTNLFVLSCSGDGLEITIKDIHFINLSQHSVALVITTSTLSIKSKIFKTSFMVYTDVTDYFSSVFKEEFIGTKLCDITIDYLSDFACKFLKYKDKVNEFLFAVYDLSKEFLDYSVYAKGHANLFFREEANKEDLSKFSEFSEDKEALRQIIGFKSDKLTTVKIGEENHREELNNSSLVVTRCYMDDKIIGSLAVVGPIRVDYQRLIPSVEYVAQSFGRAYSQITDDFEEY